MSAEDRSRWDARYSDRATVVDRSARLPEIFSTFAAAFPTTGSALDVACGQGPAAVWLASRGLEVWGLDVSPVAIAAAGELARHCGVAERCRFDVVDLDAGLPSGPPVDVVFCHGFRDARLDSAIIERLTHGGLLAISALSEVGSGAGRFRVRAGELTTAFDALDVITAGEVDGRAWLLGRR